MDPDADLAPPPKPHADIPTAAIPGQTLAQPPRGPAVSMPGAAPISTPSYNHDSLPPPMAAPGQNPPQPNADKLYDDQPTQMQQLLANKKLLAIVGGVVLLLIILIAIVAASGSGSSSNVLKRGTTGALAALPEVVSRPDGSLDLTRRVDTGKVLRAQKVETSGLNKQVNLTSGVSMLVGAVGNYNATSGNVAAAGKKYIIILVTIGNSSLKDNISLSYLDFKLLDKSNKLISPSAMTQQILNNSIAYPTEIKPGNQLEGRLIYEVDGSEQDWVLSHKESYHKSSDDSTFYIESKIGINLKPGSRASDSDQAASDDNQDSSDSTDDTDTDNANPDEDN